MYISHEELPMFFALLRQADGTGLHIREHFFPFLEQQDVLIALHTVTCLSSDNKPVEITIFKGDVTNQFRENAHILTTSLEGEPITLVCLSITLVNHFATH